MNLSIGQLKKISEPLKRIVEHFKSVFVVSGQDTRNHVNAIIAIIDLYKKILDILQVSEDRVLAEVDVSKSFKNAVQTHTPPKFKVTGTTVPDYDAFRKDWDKLAAIVDYLKSKLNKFTTEPETDVNQFFVEYLENVYELKKELGVGNNPVTSCIPVVKQLKDKIKQLESEVTKKDSHVVAVGTAAPVAVVSDRSAADKTDVIDAGTTIQKLNRTIADLQQSKQDMTSDLKRREERIECL